MKATVVCLGLLFAVVVQAQQPAVPRVTYFNGVATDAAGKPQTGTVGITFALYEEQQGGAALWSETQNVPLDGQGRYTVLLGSTQPEGLPLDLFASGKARWLGVTPQVAGVAEQPRVLLVGVPYALKAADADTLGGLPASAFLTAAASAGSPVAPSTASPESVSPADTTAAVTGSGKADYIPVWSTASKLGSSVLFQSGTGDTAEVGINTATPGSTLDVNGTTSLGGATTLPATGTATASAGNNSQPLDLVASAYNSGVGVAVAQTFQLQAEPAGNDSATTSGVLSLLYGSGSNVPAETGLKIASNGQITFAAGQTFPGAGNGGTVTSVGSGTGLTGGPITTSGTLSVDTTKVPLLGSANSFTSSQTTNGQWISTVANGTAPLQVSSKTQVANLNASLLGGVAASSFATTGANSFNGTQTINSGNLDLPLTSAATSGVIEFTGLPFLHACCSALNAFVGVYSGGFGVSGLYDVGVGGSALEELGSGGSNTAVGYSALRDNIGGSSNTALGAYAGFGTAGTDGNVSGSSNTFVGYNAAPGTTTQLSNATAIGANAVVSANNALVLGSINGVNGATASTNVGIGTASPTAPLQVNGNVMISGTGSTLTFPDGSVQSTAPASGPAGVVAVNPLQVALLKWFPAYQSGATFSVGNFPAGVAFDGANIWVTNWEDGSVTKLLASTGAVVGTYSVGANPVGVAFDGANIWVANYNGKSLTKLQASTGAAVGTYVVGNGPECLAFDGANIWAANQVDNTVTKILANTGAAVGTYNVGTYPYGVAFDGTNIWVTNVDSNSVTKLLASTGAVVGTYIVGTNPAGVAFDGANIWVVNNGSNTVTKLQASTGTVLGTYSVGANPLGVAFDGANVWVANSDSASVTKLQASTGVVLGTYSVDNPYNVAFDGANIWVTNVSLGTVTKL